MMNERSLPFQEAAFEAIKAKHQNMHAYLSNKSDPFLLELADMILLISAQLALLSGVSLHSDSVPKENEPGGKPRHRGSPLS